jgi:hypothetical protein
VGTQLRGSAWWIFEQIEASTLKTTTRPNLAPRPAGVQGPNFPGRPPRRDEIAAATIEVLKIGAPAKADLLVVDVGEGPMVVKDFAAKPWWARLVGRLLISREARAYAWLRETSGVPRLIGRVDSHALALEKIEGMMLFPAEQHSDDGEVLLPRIRALVDRLHATGLTHLDLNRQNLMRTADDEIMAVDLAGAVWFTPGGIAHRLLFRLFAVADETAYLKWKARLTPGSLDAAEERRFRRLKALRALWPFNRKPSRPNPKF